MTENNTAARFTLLRHGAVAGRAALYGQTNIELSELGLMEMQQAVQLVNQQDPIDRVVSSPLLRCATFAETYSENNELDIILESRISEMDFGRWDGIPFDRLRPHWSKLEAFWENPYKNTPPQGETLKQFGIRVKSVWHELLEHNQGQHYLLVCHAGVIKMLLAIILDVDWRNSLWFSQLKVDYASVTKIEVPSHKNALPMIKTIGCKPGCFFGDINDK
ncbi:histidine phosphatase family protein [Catenovulum sediminis]|uniref:histidine phosphatase family protein n=1 Tax=Catenovulum sediminis TaxID=1740262 RepID=UPI0011805613|nr:histidine phosphatase family protein [Catenovulum sediminis]